jgi:hypothetical protein
MLRLQSPGEYVGRPCALAVAQMADRLGHKMDYGRRLGHPSDPKRPGVARHDLKFYSRSAGGLSYKRADLIF